MVYCEEMQNLDEIFGRRAPIFLEIGFGMGEATAVIAAQHPENNYLGIEVHTPGVGALLRKIEELGLDNIRIVQHDAVDVIKHMIPSQSLSGVHIFFPDPWPKSRHHKRRLIQSPLVALLCEKLKADGYIHIATDWESYAEHIASVLENEPCLRHVAEAHADARPSTKFEQRGLKLGYQVWDFIYERRPDPQS